ncbi:glycosyltransferase family 2 protein [Candidatus Gracilibacteria bacterium]|nr:glycosyltransferase family 2 protein [Candidatus Gracilibacteria bacterium]
MQKTPKISVIILNYLKAKRVIENINFLKNQKGDFDLEIILVDNSCDKNEKEILSKLKKNNNLKIIFNEKNYGYTKGNNIGVKYASGDFILILNPDILIKDENAIFEMLKFLQNDEKIGIIGPKQINDNGEIPIIIRRFPNLFTQIARRTFLRKIPGIKKIVEKDEYRDLDLDQIQSVDWIQSSCFMLSKKLWNKIGGFDESYKIFLADPEICFQSWKLGKKVIYFPKIQVFADGKRASFGGFLKFFQSWVLRQHFLDSIKYFFKHIFSKNPREEFYFEKNKNLIG